MSIKGATPRGDGDDPEAGATQWGAATRGGRVNQAMGNQYILNLGNAAWVTVPVVVAVAIMSVVYLAIGRAGPAAGTPARVAASSQSRQPSAAVSRQSPVTVTLAYDEHDVDNGAGACSNWILGHSLSELPAPPDGVVNETWARQFGGVDVGKTDFKVVVQGATETAVQLLGFRVVDIERGPAISGTHISNSAGCGPSAEAGFEIALLGNPPAITPVAGLDGKSAKRIPFPFVVSNTDIQQFQVAANVFSQSGTDSCSCDIKWRLALDWSYEGKMGTTLIDDHGKPFQTVLPPQTESVISWVDEGGTWKRFP